MALGAKNVQVAGNIKTAQEVRAIKKFEKPKRRLVVYASTHKGEEALLLAFHSFKKDEMVVVVPRHPERFEEVDRFLTSIVMQKALEYKKFSKDGFCECDLLLVDTIGELVNIYAISDVVVLCGSFVPLIGGHNPIEPATFNNAIISGKYTHNQKELYKYVENIYVVEFDEVDGVLKNSELKTSHVQKDNSLEIISEYINKEIN